MITIYTVLGSLASRKAIKWLKENNVPFVERKVKNGNELTADEIMHIISSVGDIHELISNRVRSKIDIEDMPIKSELIPLIIKNPKMLTFPIVVRKSSVHKGFKDEEYTTFLSKKQKRQEFEVVLSGVSV